MVVEKADKMAVTTAETLVESMADQLAVRMVVMTVEWKGNQ